MVKSKKKGITLTTPVFRAAYTDGVFEARAMDDDPKSKKKYGLTAIWDPSEFTEKDKKLWAEMKDALNKVCLDVHGDSWDDLVAAGGNFRAGLRSGGEPKRKDKPGFGKGKFFASLNTGYKPGVVGPPKGNGQKPDPIGPEDDEVFSGCYMRATVVVYAFDNKGPGAAFMLNNLQKIRDGERLDGRGDAADDFEDDVDESWLDQSEEPADAATEFVEEEDL